MDDKGTENLKWSYEHALKIFEIQNDNYLKRISILWPILQVGLVAAILNYLGSLNDQWSWKSELVVGLSSLLGGSIALLWWRLQIKQHQYIEYCKRYLRNIEAALLNRDVPYAYFTVERLIFSGEKQPPDPPKLNQIGKLIPGENSPRVFEFLCGREKYPNPDAPVGSLHHPESKRGGVTGLETRVAYFMVWVWGVLAAIMIGKILGSLIFIVWSWYHWSVLSYIS